MKTRFESHESVRAMAVHLKGDYYKLDYQSAMQKLQAYCAANKIEDCGSAAEYINVYHDDPRHTPCDSCRASVSIVHPICSTLTSSEDVEIIDIEGGKFVVFTLEGPYADVAAQTYCKIYGEILPNADYRYKEDAATWERYVSNPDTTSPDEYVTEIWIPIE